MRNPYEVLGVAKNASAKDIKSAYRKLAKKFHPDQNPDDPKAKDRFAAVNQAYEVVGDEKARGAFDRGEIDAEGKPRFQGFEGAAGGDPFAGFRRSGAGAGSGGPQFEFRGAGGPGGDPFGDAGDLFSQLFGDAFARGGGAGAQTRQPVGADLQATLEVSIEDVASAAKVTAMFPGGRKIAVKLPAYVEDGQTIRLKGQGEQLPGVQPGDALITIRIARHPKFRLEGREVHVDLPVDWADAVLGAKVPVDTPTGRIAVTVPAWSSSDKVMRAKGRGLPLKGGGHADLFVHVRVMLPSGGDADLEALARRKRG